MLEKGKIPPALKGLFLHKLTLTSLVVLGFLLASSVQGHSRGESYSKWYISDNKIQMTYTLALKDISQLSDYFQAQQAGWQERVKQHIQTYTLLFNNGYPCEALIPFKIRQSAGYLQLEGNFKCNSTDRLKIINNSIFDIDSRHMHILRIIFVDENMNTNISEKVLLDRDREWKLYENDNSNSVSLIGASTLLTYFIIGVEHIASGWDHLGFLAAICLLLLLMKASTKILIMTISGFTLGHSASLILTVLGYLSPNSLVVESFIAFSISLLAVESIAFKSKQYFSLSIVIVIGLLLYLVGSFFAFSSVISYLAIVGLAIFVFCYFNLSSQNTSTLAPLLLTLLFGLVHGFGFAGSLQDIGLPQERLITALVSFNVGVEIGQLLIVGLGLFVLAQIRKLFERKHLASNSNIQEEQVIELSVELCAAFLCGLGLFWFIERSII